MIYVFCILFLVLGCIVIMVGVEVLLGYFCFVGVMIVFNGIFDCFFFGIMRNVIIFVLKYEIGCLDVGFIIFRFM